MQETADAVAAVDNRFALSRRAQLLHSVLVYVHVQGVGVLLELRLHVHEQQVVFLEVKLLHVGHGQHVSAAVHELDRLQNELGLVSTHDGSSRASTFGGGCTCCCRRR